MTATFWTGSSLSFTNGSKTVTVNTGPSLDSVKANSSLKSGNYSEPVEVKSASGNTITLYNNWPGSTGTTSATIKPSAAAAASAGVAAQQLITEIQNLVGSASATATANSFVKRDSNGRMKAAAPSANDDVVTKGHLGSAATKNIGSSSGDVMTVSSFDIGQVGNATTFITNSLDTTQLPTRFGRGQLDDGTYTTFVNMRGNNSRQSQIHVSYGGSTRVFVRSMGTNDIWNGDVELYHSGNTNFDEFGGEGNGDEVLLGIAASGTIARFWLENFNKEQATGLTINSGAFRVDTVSGTTVSTGQPSVNVSLSSLKSTILEVPVTGISGTGEILRLRCDGGAAYATVNH